MPRFLAEKEAQLQAFYTEARLFKESQDRQRQKGMGWSRVVHGRMVWRTAYSLSRNAHHSTCTDASRPQHQADTQLRIREHMLGLRATDDMQLTTGHARCLRESTRWRG